MAKTRQRVVAMLSPYLLWLLLALPLAAVAGFILHGREIHFRYSRAAFLFLTLPLLAWIGFHLEPRRVGTLNFSRTRDLLATEQGLFGHLRHLPRVVRLCAMGVVVLALMRPQRISTEATEIEGIDIVVALDVSNSMAESDLAPDRISAAKQVIDDFMLRRSSDRLALVLFGKEAVTECPLTLDTRAVRNMLAGVQLGILDGRGTAIGNAIGTAINRLRKSSAKSKVLVLVTDGDDNASKLDPTKAAEYARTFGVKIFTILIGRDTVETEGFPGTDRFGNPIHILPRYPANPRLLESVANLTDGVAYLATDAEGLHKRFQSILEDLDRSKLRSQLPHHVELYPRFIALAFGLLLAEVLLSLTRFRRFP
jgi:Ca-activated chloride channel family protein